MFHRNRARASTLVIICRVAALVVGICVLMILCSVCKTFNAKYASGIEIQGYDDNATHIFWFGDRPQAAPCPQLVVHFRENDIDNAQLSSSKTMQDLGGTIINRNQERNDFEVWLIRDGGRVICGYAGDTLTKVSVSGYKGGGKISVTVDGKCIGLPASSDEVLRVFGEPVKAWTSYRRLGANHPHKTEPHL